MPEADINSTAEPNSRRMMPGGHKLNLLRRQFLVRDGSARFARRFQSVGWFVWRRGRPRRSVDRQREGPPAAQRVTAAMGHAVSTAADSEPERLRRLEAVLFLAREPLSSRKLADLAGLADGTQARTLVRRLNDRFDRRQRAFHIQHVAEGYFMVTRRPFAPWLRRLQGNTVIRTPLSSPAMETLTVIAYRQPIVKAEIEAIRGVSCSDILRQLMERDMVRISGRSAELGRPFLYGTTRQFLRTFGLPSLDALPQADQLRGTGLPTWLNESQHLESNAVDSAETSGDHSEELNVRHSSPMALDELDSDLLEQIAGSACPAATAPDVRNAEEEDLEDEDLEEDDEDFDDEDDDEDDEDDDEDDDFEDDDWEEVDDDDEEDWEDDEDDDDEDWDEDYDDEDDDWE